MTQDAGDTSSIIYAAAESTATITKECIVGGPITCVSLVLLDDGDNDAPPASGMGLLCYYGQGPFLHCTTTMVNHSGVDEKEQINNKNSSQQLLVFPQGGSIHGIRFEEHRDNRPVNRRTRYESTLRQRTKIMLVFGGNQISFVQHHTTLSNNRSSALGMQRLAIDQEHSGALDLGQVHKNSQQLTVSDWIWDCRLCHWDGEGRTSACTDEFILLVGLAHNTVQVWSVRALNDPEVRIQARHVRSIQGITRSISYCMDIFWLPNSTPDNTVEISTGTVAASIAVGTVTNEILVWSLSNEEIAATTTDMATIQQRHTPEHHLPGHEGVIHAVRWCRRTYNYSSHRLVSTSDDRSVRLWSQHAESNQWILQWTAWGHTARGWDVAWGQTLATGDTEVVLSTGEDGKMRIWDAQTGNALAVARGHACRCIWSVDTATVRGIDYDAPTDDEHEQTRTLNVNVAVTGGNDGTVAFYSLDDRIQGKHSWDRLTQSKDSGDGQNGQEKAQTASWRGSFLVPDDRLFSDMSYFNTAREESKKTCCDDAVPIPPLSKKKKERKSKLQQQVLIGRAFTQNEVSTTLVVATQLGSLMKLHPALGEWTFLRPWCNFDTTSVDPRDGRCMSLHPTKSLVAIGTQKGNIVITTITQQSIECSGIDLHPSDNNVRVLNGREHRAVQRLEWLSDNKLLSFHVQSIVMWTFHSTTSEDQGSRNSTACTCTASALDPLSTGVVICYAYEEASSSLVFGDTRGSLMLFQITDNKQPPDGLFIFPSSVKPRVHQKEHVTAVVWQSSNRLLSVGNDGHIVESIIENGQFVKLLSVTMGLFTGLSRIWTYGKSGVVVGGYHGNEFAIVDVGSGYEYFSFDTGGRQRPLSIWVDIRETTSNVFPLNLYTATSISRKDGCNEIEMLRLGPLTGAKPEYSLLHSKGVSLHSESVFDLCIFPLDPRCKRVALLTGSEDCTSKISVFENGLFSSSKLLPPHASGIRAVCISTLASGSVIMVIGGKVEVQLFAMSGCSEQRNFDFCVKNLGFGRPPVKPAIDQRLNTVKAVPLECGREEVLLVAAGDSSGSCFLYRFSGLSVAAKSEVSLLCQVDRPIIALEIVKYGEYYILLLGTTLGEIAAYSLPGTSDPEAWNGITNTKSILRYSAHSMGANAISARVVDVSGSRRLRICSGGDDQSIFCCDVALVNHMSEKGLVATVVETCCVSDASSSALKGITFMDDYHLAATGYNQIVSIWRIGKRNAKLSLVADAAVDIGDINCLAHCDVGMGKHLLAAGGAGVELLSVFVDITSKQETTGEGTYSISNCMF